MKKVSLACILGAEGRLTSAVCKLYGSNKDHLKHDVPFI